MAGCSHLPRDRPCRLGFLISPRAATKLKIWVYFRRSDASPAGFPCTGASLWCLFACFLPFRLQGAFAPERGNVGIPGKSKFYGGKVQDQAASSYDQISTRHTRQGTVLLVSRSKPRSWTSQHAGVAQQGQTPTAGLVLFLPIFPPLLLVTGDLEGSFCRNPVFILHGVLSCPLPISSHLAAPWLSPASELTTPHPNVQLQNVFKFQNVLEPSNTLLLQQKSWVNIRQVTSVRLHLECQLSSRKVSEQKVG